MASWLVRLTPDRAVRFETWPGTFCCVQGQNTLLSQYLSLATQVYKWVPVMDPASLNWKPKGIGALTIGIPRTWGVSRRDG